MKSGEDVYKVSYRAHGTNGNARLVTGRTTPELQDEFDKVWVRFSLLI